MQKVKFRGIPVVPVDKTEYGEWIKDGFVYGYLIGNDVIVGEIIDFEEDYFNTEFWCRVKPETVGQYTGLNDKNNQEIYRGDILGKESHWGIFIGYKEGNLMIIPCDPVQRMNSKWIPVPEGIFEGWKVIGNIYENPELLEVE